MQIPLVISINDVNVFAHELNVSEIDKGLDSPSHTLSSHVCRSGQFELYARHVHFQEKSKEGTGFLDHLQDRHQRFTSAGPMDIPVRVAPRYRVSTLVLWGDKGAS